MPLESVNINSTPHRYLGIKSKITAPLFLDEPVVPFNSGVLSCTYADCRNFQGGADCYVNPVFGNIYDTNPIYNDKTSFLFFYPFTTSSEFNNSSLSYFTLEKFSNTGGWSTITPLTGSTYGTYYNFESLAISGYKGFEIDWRLVLAAFGEGTYRYKVQSNIYGTTSCVASPEYCLKNYSCHAAHGTTRFDATITGKIGKHGRPTESGVVDLATQSTLLDLTGINWNMSLRIPGFFGNEKTEYETTNIEYENGQVVNVRDEAIQKYEWTSGRLPKYVHDQFKIYFLMADSLAVSDYNYNNSDYFINQKQVIKEGNYEPEYSVNSRLSRVKVAFKDRVQNVIKVKC